MKKIACLSQHWPQFWLSPQVLPVAATSTVTGGYAQSDAQGQMNKMGGFNLKYRYEEDNSPLGVIGSFTYTEKSHTASSGDYNKNQYYGITAGPAYRINDWASIYGVVGVGYGKFQTTEYPTYKHDTSDYGFSYGAGLQFNPMENVALDFSYEQSRIRSVDVGTGLPVLVTASNHFGDIKIRLSGRIFVLRFRVENIGSEMVVIHLL
ncbi:outer membrane protein OmpX [Escherichia coli]|nr:outer membrane protein OmpX [Escherichia coli]